MNEREFFQKLRALNLEIAKLIHEYENQLKEATKTEPVADENSTSIDLDLSPVEDGLEF